MSRGGTLIFSATFCWKDIQGLIAKSKEKLTLVHDDGTYLMSDVFSKELGTFHLAKPISGGLEAGRGDDFGEDFPLATFTFPKGAEPETVIFRVYPNSISMTANVRRKVERK